MSQTNRNWAEFVWETPFGHEEWRGRQLRHMSNTWRDLAGFALSSVTRLSSLLLRAFSQSSFNPFLVSSFQLSRGFDLKKWVLRLILAPHGCSFRKKESWDWKNKTLEVSGSLCFGLVGEEFGLKCTCMDHECSSALPLKERLLMWFLSCSISSGFCCWICWANCCPLNKRAEDLLTWCFLTNVEKRRH